MDRTKGSLHSDRVRMSVLAAATLFIGIPPARAVPLTSWRRSSLEQHFVDAHHTTAKLLEERFVQQPRKGGPGGCR